MATHRTNWTNTELLKLHAWIAAQPATFAMLPIERQVVLAQQAVLHATRQRDNVKWHGQAEKVMMRMEEAVAQGALTAKQAAQAPAFTAPLAPVPQATIPTVFVQHGTTMVVALAPGKYMLEVL